MSTSENKKSDNLLTGLEIKRLREDLSINQADFAEEIGIDRSYLSQIENGKIDPAEKLLRRISNILQQKSASHLKENFQDYRSVVDLPPELQKSVIDWALRCGMSPRDFVARVLIDYGRQTRDDLLQEKPNSDAESKLKSTTAAAAVQLLKKTPEDPPTKEGTSTNEQTSLPAGAAPKEKDEEHVP